mmetsp:Transcript_15880/g.39166  ORF Transcript_15880/g.39166 Transcript_15880/m.39166 type:complete len:350 (+) Transcript_15880:326-1375(+)
MQSNSSSTIRGLKAALGSEGGAPGSGEGGGSGAYNGETFHADFYESPILGHHIDFGHTMNRIFILLLYLHLAANVILLLSGALAYLFPFQSSTWHPVYGRVFVSSFIITIVLGLSMIAIRTTLEGLFNSQGFSGSVNLYFVFISLCVVDFFIQGIAVGIRRMRGLAYAILPAINILFGACLFVFLGIVPYYDSHVPSTWKAFEPVVVVFIPIFMLFEGLNVYFHTFYCCNANNPNGKYTWRVLEQHHIRNLACALAVGLSIFLGDVCINKFWSVASFLSNAFGDENNIAAVWAIRTVIIGVFGIPLALPLNFWVRYLAKRSQYVHFSSNSASNVTSKVASKRDLLSFPD